MSKPIECKSEMGITIGLIDAIISIANILAPRLRVIDDELRLGTRGDVHQPIRDALTDLCVSSELRRVVDGQDNGAYALIHKAAGLLTEKTKDG